RRGCRGAKSRAGDVCREGGQGSRIAPRSLLPAKLPLQVLFVPVAHPNTLTAQVTVQYCNVVPDVHKEAKSKNEADQIRDADHQEKHNHSCPSSRRTSCRSLTPITAFPPRRDDIFKYPTNNQDENCPLQRAPAHSPPPPFSPSSRSIAPPSALYAL